MSDWSMLSRQLQEVTQSILTTWVIHRNHYCFTALRSPPCPRALYSSIAPPPPSTLLQTTCALLIRHWISTLTYFCQIISCAPPLLRPKTCGPMAMCPLCFYKNGLGFSILKLDREQILGASLPLGENDDAHSNYTHHYLCLVNV